MQIIFTVLRRIRIVAKRTMIVFVACLFSLIVMQVAYGFGFNLGAFWTQAASSVWEVLNGNAYYLAGNVGIGTSTPQSSLQVANGYVQYALTSGSPPVADCNTTAHYGRQKTDVDTDPDFPKTWVCTAKGWKRISSSLHLPGACLGGVQIGGFCFYLGELGESCTEVCASHFAFDYAGTIGFAGSGGGTSNNCSQVLDALGIPTIGNTPYSGNCTNGGTSANLRYLGCFVWGSTTRQWCDFRPTTENHTHSNVYRACACVD